MNAPLSDFERHFRYVARTPAAERRSLPDQILESARCMLHLSEQIDEPELSALAAIWFSELLLNAHDKAANDNIGEAIEALTCRLSERPADLSTATLARMHHRLGDACRARASGIEDLRETIEHYCSAIELYPQGSHRRIRARLHHRIGLEHLQLFNPDEAISHYAEACRVFTRDDYPARWALVQSDVANALLLKSKPEDTESAITVLKRVLTVFDRSDAPFYWGHASHRLGMAYEFRETGDESHNISQAIDFYSDALSVFRRRRYPESWAAVYRALGSCYAKRAAEDESHRQTAIECLNLAQSVFTKNDHLREWAGIESRLGYLIGSTMTGDRRTNLRVEKEHYQRAIEAYEMCGLSARADVTKRMLAINSRIADVLARRDGNGGETSRDSGSED